MKKYKIVLKRDFGNRSFLIKGKWVSKGFVVTDGICNIMPGATWFQTIEDAMEALEVLIMVDFDYISFWTMMRIGKRKNWEL